MKKATNAIKVKVLKMFRDPLTNRMAEVGHVMNVPKSRFWFKRLKDGDIEKVSKLKAKAPKAKAEVKENKKGSK